MKKRKNLILTIVLILMSILFTTGCSSVRKLDIDPLLIEIGENIYNEIEFIHQVKQDYDRFASHEIDKVLEGTDIAIDSLEQLERRAETEDELKFVDDLYHSYEAGLQLIKANLRMDMEQKRLREIIFEDEYKKMEQYHSLYN